MGHKKGKLIWGLGQKSHKIELSKYILRGRTHNFNQMSHLTILEPVLTRAKYINKITPFYGTIVPMTFYTHEKSVLSLSRFSHGTN